MHPYLEKTENVFDALIVPALLAILGIVILNCSSHKQHITTTSG